MKVLLVLLSFLSFFIEAKTFDKPALRNKQTDDDKSFEKELREGYELLKNQPYVDDTKELVLKLHKMEKEIKDELTGVEEKNSESLDSTKDDVDSEDVFIQLTGGDSIEEINQNSKVAITLYEGDMVLTKEQAEEILEGIKENKGERSKRQASRSKYCNNTWSNGVYYYFYSNTSSLIQRVFTKAVYDWQNDTCINFYENDTAPDRIAVFYGIGCWSEVGRIGGEQRLSLGPRCGMVGYAAHEIGHALGFYHTHSRYDRNKFVKFYRKNIMPNYSSQFTKKTKSINDNYNLTYDYGSVMHYGARGFSINRKPILIPRDENYLYTIGSAMISFYDKLMMNTLYGCHDNCKEGNSAVCQNGGFPHPRNCTKCICPSGYGGRLCDERPEGCGDILTARSFFQTLISEVGNMGDPIVRDEFSKCTYWIEAPLGSKIEVEIEYFQYDVATDGCRFAGVEIKSGSDKRLTGYRFCSPNHYGITLVSTYNVVPIITYSNIFSVTTYLRYRIAPPNSSEIPETSTQPTTTTTSGCRESYLCTTLMKSNFCGSVKFTESVRKKFVQARADFARSRQFREQQAPNHFKSS